MSAAPPSAAEGHEPHPDPQLLTSNPNPGKNTSSGVDNEPHPESSIPVSAERENIIKSITNLYLGSASEQDMQVYTEKAIYDDRGAIVIPDIRLLGIGGFELTIAPFGIPVVMASSKTLATEVVSSKDDKLVFKLRQEYKPHLIPAKAINSLVSLSLIKDEKGAERVTYHKDMWNEKDYSHVGLGKVMKTLNGNHLTKITAPPKSLQVWWQNGTNKE